MADRRRAIDRLFRWLTRLALLFSAGLLAVILVTLVDRGLDRLSLAFLVEVPRQAGIEGGIGPAILGTALMSATAGILAMPLGLGLALLLTEYLRHRLARRLVGVMLYAINGVPSILFGLAGYHLLVKGLGMGKSWVAGGVVLAAMITPTVAIAAREAIRALPRVYRDQARALGLSPAKVIWSVVVPQSFAGILTGLLLGLARACGETAPIMLTAAVFSGANVPRGIVESPVLALPYHVFNLAQDSHDPRALSAAWSTALVLVLAVLVLNLASLPLRSRLAPEAEG